MAYELVSDIANLFEFYHISITLSLFLAFHYIFVILLCILSNMFEFFLSATG